MVMLIRQGNCCFLKLIIRQFATYVTEMDNKIINTNVRILCMASVFNFDTILPKQRWQKSITGHFRVKKLYSHTWGDVIFIIGNEL